MTIKILTLPFLMLIIMRIGFDAKRAFFNFSGLGNYSRTLIQNLAAFYPDNEYFLYTPKSIERAETNAFFDAQYNLKLAPKAMPNSIWRGRFILSDLKKDGIDIYHGLSHELPLNIGKSDIRTVVTIHDLIFIRYPNLYPLIDRKIYLAKIKHACRSADRVIAISEQTKKDIVRFTNTPESKIEIVYQSCGAIFRQGYSEEAITSFRKKHNLPIQFLLYVGTIEERKNLLLIARALTHLPKEIKCVAIGRKTDYFKQVNHFISQENLSGRMLFPENITYNELPLLYHCADVFIYPSRFEGFGIPILEAICCDIPVIAAKNSCLEETGGVGSLYIDPDNEQALADGVSEIMGSSDLRQSMIIAGRQHAEKFSPAHTSKTLLTVYQNIL